MGPQAEGRGQILRFQILLTSNQEVAVARAGSAATNKGHGASTEQMIISASQLLVKKHCSGYDFVIDGRSGA